MSKRLPETLCGTPAVNKEVLGTRLENFDLEGQVVNPDWFNCTVENVHTATDINHSRRGKVYRVPGTARRSLVLKERLAQLSGEFSDVFSKEREFVIWTEQNMRYTSKAHLSNNLSDSKILILEEKRRNNYKICMTKEL